MTALDRKPAEDQSRHMHLLVSSMSARGRALTVAPDVVRRLRAGGWKVTVSVTKAEDNLRALSDKVDAPFVGALGGDGYLAQTAQSVQGSDAVFVPLPGGRGNDLCRALGLSPDPLKRADQLASYMTRQPGHNGADGVQFVEDHIRCVDAMWLDEGDKPAMMTLGIVSLGFDSAVNQIANDSWFRSGPIAYGYGALAGFGRYTERQVRALVDGEDRDMSGWIASVSNSGWFGGGIQFVPTSQLGDGQMELVHVGSASRRVVLKALVEILKSRSAEHPLIQVSQAREVRFTEPVGLQAWADGDPVATVPFTVRLQRDAVRMLA